MDLSRNNLGSASSPYLIQHQDNPVHWQVWSPDVLAAAKDAGKPILLSVGYAACHWCHVMAHESFENELIANVMNQHFTCIKVDREEHPEVDMIYQQSLSLLGQQGGWPLTMFLTETGDPFWGGTYFPPADQYGRPGFPKVLEEMARLFNDDKAQVTKNRDAIKQALQNLQTEGAGNALSRAHLTPIAKNLCRQTDPFHGGFGDAPKFPNTYGLELLWRAYLREGLAPYKRSVMDAIANMAQGGMYDHLGGGFHRYSVDTQWLVPHFEKMLYDNAALLSLMAMVYANDPLPLLKARMTETADFVLRDMQRSEGGFASTYDADSLNEDKGENEEGAFYVWSVEEVTKILGDEAPLFCMTYDITKQGNFEGSNIPNRLDAIDDFDLTHDDQLAPLRARLLSARGWRPKPGFDDKVLADWNGLIISALVSVGQQLDREDYVLAAIRAFDFVATQMADGNGLTHAWRNGKRTGNQVIADYANMIRAGIALFETTQDKRFLDKARQWMDHAIQTFWLDDQKGFAMTPAGSDSLIVRPRSAMDDATPSGNGVMLGNLARLIELANNIETRAALAKRAQELVMAFSGAMTKNLLAGASFLNGFDMASRPVSMIIVGAEGDERRDTLFKAAQKSATPDRVILCVSNDDDLPAFHPAKGKGLVDGSAALYLCIGNQCLAPTTDAEALPDMIKNV